MTNLFQDEQYRYNSLAEDFCRLCFKWMFKSYIVNDKVKINKPSKMNMGFWRHTKCFN